MPADPWGFLQGIGAADESDGQVIPGQGFYFRPPRPQDYQYPGPRELSQIGRPDQRLQMLNESPAPLPGPLFPQAPQMNQIYARALGDLGGIGSGMVAPFALNALKSSVNWQKGYIEGRIARAKFDQEQMVFHLKQLEEKQAEELNAYWDAYSAHKEGSADQKAALQAVADKYNDDPMRAAINVGMGQVHTLLTRRDINWRGISAANKQNEKEAAESAETAGTGATDQTQQHPDIQQQPAAAPPNYQPPPSQRPDQQQQGTQPPAQQDQTQQTAQAAPTFEQRFAPASQPSATAGPPTTVAPSITQRAAAPPPQPIAGLPPVSLPSQLSQQATGLSPSRLDQDARNYLENGKDVYPASDPLAALRNEAVRRRASQMDNYIQNTIAKRDPAHPDRTLTQIASADPGMAAYVGAVIRGDQQAPQSWQLRSRYFQIAQQLIYQLDPTYTQARYDINQRTRIAFQTGWPAQQVTAANRALQHMAVLMQAANALGNRPYPSVNALRNGIRTQLGQDAVTNFDIARAHVAQELERVFRGNGGALAEINRDIATVGSSGSPAQIKGYIRTISELLKGQLDGLADLYQRGARRPTTADDLLSGPARSTYEQIMRQPLSRMPQAAVGPATLDPPTQAQPRVFRDSSGVTHYYQGIGDPQDPANYATTPP